jgi:betaine reductase
MTAGGAREERAMELRGRKVIALGERDGVPGPAVAECATRAGAEVVLTLTACYV